MLEMILSQIAQWGLVLIGFSLVIFFHELGHFMAALKTGVRVEKFYIGFDFWGMRIARWKWGQTEYGIGVFPLGGYVKMAGQEDLPQDETNAKKSDTGNYQNKTVSQRMLIIVAGVVMNFITGFALFVPAFLMGMNVLPPVVGDFVQGEKNLSDLPGYKAGLRRGDRILAINGSPVNKFQDVSLAALVCSSSMTLTVERLSEEGTRQQLDIQVEPKTGAGLIGRMELGIRAEESLNLAQMHLFRVLFRQRLDELAQSVADRKTFFEKRLLNLDAFIKELPAEMAGDRESWQQRRVEMSRRVEVLGTLETFFKKPHDQAATVRLTQVDGKPVAKMADAYALWHLDTVGTHAFTIAALDATGRTTDALEVSFQPIQTYRLGIAMSGFSLDAEGKLTEEMLPRGVRVDRVEEDYPATGKLNPGDVILAADASYETVKDKKNGSPAEVMEAVYSFTRCSEGLPVSLRVLPGGKADATPLILAITPKLVNTRPDFISEFTFSTMLDFLPKEEFFQEKKLTTAMHLGWNDSLAVADQVLFTLKNLVTGGISVKAISGPVGIFYIAKKTSEQGISDLLRFMGLISINLAIVNLLPIPVLDGGHLLVLLAEGIRRRPLPVKLIERLQWAGLICLLALILFVVYQDILKLAMGRFF